MIEDQLWDAVVKGDDSKFRELFDLFYPVLCLYAKKYVEYKDANEDIVQNVFVSLWENRNKIIITTSIRNYLTASIKNQCFDYLRKDERMRQYVDYKNIYSSDIASSNDDFFLLGELQELVKKTLNQLPESYGLVFEMHRMEGIDYAEIAEKLKISVRTAKRYNMATIELLKKDLNDYLPLILFLCLISYFRN